MFFPARKISLTTEEKACDALLHFGGPRHSNKESRSWGGENGGWLTGGGVERKKDAKSFCGSKKRNPQRKEYTKIQIALRQPSKTNTYGGGWGSAVRGGKGLFGGVPTDNQRKKGTVNKS